jgi:hypothetical protein
MSLKDKTLRAPVHLHRGSSRLSRKLVSVRASKRGVKVHFRRSSTRRRRAREPRKASRRVHSRGTGRWLRSSRVDAAVTARLLLCVVQGMRVLGKTGRSREEMASLVDSALKLLD